MINISIVIPSFNRGGMVSVNIQKCLALRPQAKEIILVDDHSDTESEEILRALEDEYPSVRYIRLPMNGGQSVSRSVGLATASGKYIVSLDDDSWFLDDDSLQRVWDRMEVLPLCGVLAFELTSPGLQENLAVDRLMLVSDHITCGAAYRSDVLKKTGYHLDFLRFEGEESDISIKVMGEGYDIILDENIRVFHDYDQSKRTRESLNRIRQYAVRNDLLRSVIYFHFPTSILLLAGKVVSHFIFGLKRGYLWPTLKGYFGFIFLLPLALFRRQPISPAASKRYLKLRRNPEPFKL